MKWYKFWKKKGSKTNSKPMTKQIEVSDGTTEVYRNDVIMNSL